MQEEDSLFIHQATINLHETSPRFILVILYDNKVVYISQRIHKNKLMYLKYQVPCGKTESEEMEKKAVKREVIKETNLYIKDDQLHFLTNDLTFNYDIYFTKLNRFEIPERTKPHNIRN